MTQDWKQNIGRTLKIKVTPNASTNRIKPIFDANFDLKIYVTATAEDGKANESVIKLLAAELEISKNSIEISKGLTSQIKTVTIT